MLQLYIHGYVHELTQGFIVAPVNLLHKKFPKIRVIRGPQLLIYILYLRGILLITCCHSFLCFAVYVPIK